jgi:predicted RND superfamily exporter protein
MARSPCWSIRDASRRTWERGPREQFVKELRTVDPQVAGDAVTLREFTDEFCRASVEASVYAVLAIFVLLMMTFRGWALPLLAMIPLVAGTLWTLGIMGLVGIQFNLANTIFLPLIVGAGVEYGIIILHRWREGRMQPGHLPFSTGKGVILCALTTTVGFGSLMICRHRGIASLGFLAFAGSLMVLAAAVIILPAILGNLKQPGTIPGEKP